MFSRLSKNFIFEELTHTESHLPNVPTKKEIANLTALVQNVLQPARDLLGSPIYVHSGFRSPEVNKQQGGTMRPLSQHCKGEAADLEVFDNAALFHLIYTNLPFDKLIWEGGNERQPDWVHVSYKANRNRKLVLRMKTVNGQNVYEPIEKYNQLG